MFNQLHSNVNQQLLEKNFCNQELLQKFWMISIAKGSHHMPPPNTLFTVSKDTKENAGKNAL